MAGCAGNDGASICGDVVASIHSHDAVRMRRAARELLKGGRSANDVVRQLLGESELRAPSRFSSYDSSGPCSDRWIVRPEEIVESLAAWTRKEPVDGLAYLRSIEDITDATRPVEIACIIVEQSPDPVQLDLLVSLIVGREKDPSAAVQAVRAMRAFGGHLEAYTEELSGALYSRYVGPHAARTIAADTSVRAEPQLVAALSSASRTAHLNALWALAYLPNALSDAALAAVIEKIAVLGSARVIWFLSMRPELERTKCVERILLNSSSTEDLECAAGACCVSRSESGPVRSGLAKLMTDGNGRCAQWAALALGRMGGAYVENQLIGVALSRDDEVAVGAIEGLGEVARTSLSAYEFVIERAQNSRSDKCKAAALHAIWRSQRSNVMQLPVVQTLAQSRDPGIQDAVRRIIIR